MRARIVAALIALACATPAFAGGATITIVNVNAPGVGFNDPTPAVPVGGNTGVTVGEQRLIAFQFAADLWGSTLDSSVEINIQSSFVPLSCTTTAATLGSAGAIPIFRDAPGMAYTNTWYYGLDTNHTASQINLVTVLLHEFAHGLGFSSFASVSTGQYACGFSDVYSKFYYDNSAGKFRDQMDDAGRLASAINPRNVVWTGATVDSKVPGTNHGGYVSCGANLTNTLNALGFISGDQKGAIQSAIARDK